MLRIGVTTVRRGVSSGSWTRVGMRGLSTSGGMTQAGGANQQTYNRELEQMDRPGSMDMQRQKELEQAARDVGRGDKDKFFGNKDNEPTGANPEGPKQAGATYMDPGTTARGEDGQYVFESQEQDTAAGQLTTDKAKKLARDQIEGPEDVAKLDSDEVSTAPERIASMGGGVQPDAGGSRSTSTPKYTNQ